MLGRSIIRMIKNLRSRIRDIVVEQDPEELEIQLEQHNDRFTSLTSQSEHFYLLASRLREQQAEQEVFELQVESAIQNKFSTFFDAKGTLEQVIPRVKKLINECIEIFTMGGKALDNVEQQIDQAESKSVNNVVQPQQQIDDAIVMNIEADSESAKIDSDSDSDYPSDEESLNAQYEELQSQLAEQQKVLDKRYKELAEKLKESGVSRDGLDAIMANQKKLFDQENPINEEKFDCRSEQQVTINNNFANNEETDIYQQVNFIVRLMAPDLSKVKDSKEINIDLLCQKIRDQADLQKIPIIGDLNKCIASIVDKYFDLNKPKVINSVSDYNLPIEIEQKALFATSFQPRIPIFVEDGFVGRDMLLDQIHSSLSGQHAEEKKSASVLTVCYGLGGVGKTQLALYYYHKSHKPYSFRCWFPAEQLETAYREFCIFFNISLNEKDSFDDVSSKVKKWLEQHSDWLLVYDNVTDYKSIAQCLPIRGGDILITSRQKLEWNPIQISGTVILIDVVSEKEAIKLVKQIAFNNEQSIPLGEQEEANLKELVKELGYLPLALVQAATYIKTYGTTITSYLNQYRSISGIGLDNLLRSNTVYPMPVTQTWLATIEEVRKRLPAALSVLCACAYLVPDAIPAPLFLQITGAILKLDPEENQNNLLFNEIMTCLSRFSMIEYNEKIAQFNINRLMQAVLREQDADSFKRLLEISAVLLSSFPKKIANFSDVIYQQQLIPHMQALIIQFKMRLDDQSENKEWVMAFTALCSRLGNVLKERNNFPEAITLFRESLENNLKMHGENSQEVEKNRNDLALALKEQGAITEACQLLKVENIVHLLRAILVSDVKIYGGNSSEVGRDRNNLAMALQEEGHAEEAIQLLQMVLTSDIEKYGKNHPDVARDWKNLGIVLLQSQDKLEEAISLFQAALESDFATYHSNNSRIAIGYHNLSNILLEQAHSLEEQGDLEKSITFHKLAFLNDFINHGCNSVQSAEKCIYLASALQAYGKEKLDEAISYFYMALDINLKIYGEGHPDVTIGCKMLASALVEKGRLSEAIAFFRKALENDLKVYGENHPEAIESRIYLASILLKQGNLQESLTLFHETAIPIDMAREMEYLNHPPEGKNDWFNVEKVIARSEMPLSIIEPDKEGKTEGSLEHPQTRDINRSPLTVEHIDYLHRHHPPLPVEYMDYPHHGASLVAKYIDPPLQLLETQAAEAKRAVAEGHLKVTENFLPFRLFTPRKSEKEDKVQSVHSVRLSNFLNSKIIPLYSPFHHNHGEFSVSDALDYNVYDGGARVVRGGNVRVSYAKSPFVFNPAPQIVVAKGATVTGSIAGASILVKNYPS